MQEVNLKSGESDEFTAEFDANGRIGSFADGKGRDSDIGIRTRWIGHGESAMEGLHTTSTRLVHSVFPGVFRAVWKTYAPVKEGAINVPSAMR